MEDSCLREYLIGLNIRTNLLHIFTTNSARRKILSYEPIFPIANIYNLHTSLSRGFQEICLPPSSEVFVPDGMLFRPLLVPRLLFVFGLGANPVVKW